MKMVARYLYVIALSLWVGGMSLFTFVLTPVIFRSYPSDVAGEIVARLFPSYFLFTLVTSAAALILFLLSFSGRASFGYRISLVFVCLAVVISLTMNLHLYPEAKKAKQEVHSFEATAADEPARRRFRSLHAQSAILNFFMFADGLALLVLNEGTRK